MNLYAVIPSVIITDNDLTPNEKILYGVIMALTDKDGYCDKTNEYISEQFSDGDNKPHSKSVGRWVNSLVRQGYFELEMLGNNKRRLWVNNRVTVNKKVEPKKKTKNKDPFKGNEETIKKIVDYLNTITGKNFRYTTKAYVSAINNALDQGYKFEDFKKAIEAKSMDSWYLDNPHYFAPTTLFAKSKIDKNIQAWTPEIRKAVQTTIKSVDEEEEFELSEEEF